MDVFPETIPKALLQSGVREEKIFFKTVTPIFGGGVITRQNDPLTPVRGPAVRGQLRFWWRATRGASCANEKELRKKEEQIWGSTTHKSRISLRVDMDRDHPGSQTVCATYPPGKTYPTFTTDFPGYALFPFQGKNSDKEEKVPPASGLVRAGFTLTVLYPIECKDDLHAALWAWSNFGGIGARTRRGCGALYSRQFSPAKNADIHEWYQSNLDAYDIRLPEEPKPWPTLPPRLMVNEELIEPMKAWNRGIYVLQAFRQGADIGRNPGQGNRPGRSRWPEADSIRRISGKACPRHRQPITGRENRFPRAELGLPIIFHFKDKKKGDPPDYTLRPVDHNRMASPLIVKPLALSEHMAVSIILHLQSPPLCGAELRSGKSHTLVRADEIRDPNLVRVPESPLHYGTTGSAIEAFLNFAKKKRGYR